MNLRSDIWASALVRRAEVGGAFAAVVRKGDPDAGAALVKIATLDGQARLYSQTLGGDGEPIWIDLARGSLGSEERGVDAYIARRCANDPDLWVIEIEDRAGRHFLVEPVEA